MNTLNINHQSKKVKLSQEGAFVRLLVQLPLTETSSINGLNNIEVYCPLTNRLKVGHLGLIQWLHDFRDRSSPCLTASSFLGDGPHLRGRDVHILGPGRRERQSMLPPQKMLPALNQPQEKLGNVVFIWGNQ